MKKSWKNEFPEIERIANNVVFSISPVATKKYINVEREIKNALRSPINIPPLKEILYPKSRVLLLVDDITRPTPRKLIIPHILDELNEIGLNDNNITILIASGTHRPMKANEVEKAFGTDVIRRVKVLNHDFRDKEQLINIGYTKKGTPIIVNRKVTEADFIMGVGSIVPHPEAGWSGGAKIFQPGICGEETIAHTHMIAAQQPDHLALAGDENNEVRLEIEQVALHGGLRFIVNVIFDADYNIVKIVAGDPISAHRTGVIFAKNIFERSIPERADIVIVDARPADIDYWQAIKPLAFATNSIRSGGIAILVGEFPDKISPVYSDYFHLFGTKTFNQLKKYQDTGQLSPGVCTEALYLHSRICERVKVICVAKHLSFKEKKILGFYHASNVFEALNIALQKKGSNASIGIILQGGDVLPRLEGEGIKDHV